MKRIQCIKSCAKCMRIASKWLYRLFKELPVLNMAVVLVNWWFLWLYFTGYYFVNLYSTMPKDKKTELNTILSGLICVFVWNTVTPTNLHFYKWQKLPQMAEMSSWSIFYLPDFVSNVGCLCCWRKASIKNSFLVWEILSKPI